MAGLVAEFESWAPLKGAVVVDAVDRSGGIYGGESPEADFVSGASVRLVVNRLELEGLEPLVRRISPTAGAGSGLFRTFAALDDSDAAVAGFTSRYGSLGVLSLTGETAKGRRVLGEVIDRWVQERRALAEAVTLIDLLRAHDNAALEPFMAERPRSRYWRATPGTRVPEWTGDVIEQGWQLVEEMFSVRARARTAGRIALLPTEERRLAPQVVSDTLLGALWMQLAFSEGRDYRACPICQRFFEVSPQVARSDRRYCDDRCRAKAYRERRREED